MAQNEAWLRAWLGKGYQSSLTYMERNVEKRADPRKLVEGARTAVVCAVSYKSRIGEGYPPGHRTKIASLCLHGGLSHDDKRNAERHAGTSESRRSRTPAAGRSSIRPRCSKNSSPSRPDWAG